MENSCFLDSSLKKLHFGQNISFYIQQMCSYIKVNYNKIKITICTYRLTMLSSLLL